MERSLKVETLARFWQHAGMNNGSSSSGAIELSFGKGFLDALFSVLLGFLIYEFPVENFRLTLLPLESFFFVVFFLSLSAKLFLHWNALRTDLTIAEVLLGQRVGTGQLALGVFVGFVYILIAKTLIRWFTAPQAEKDTLAWFFLFLLAFRLGDIAVNRRTMPRWLGQKLLDHSHPQALQQSTDARANLARALSEWYRKDLPGAISIYSLHIGIYIAAIALIVQRSCYGVMLVTIPIANVCAEVLVEVRLASGRKKLLEPTLSTGQAPTQSGVQQRRKD